MSGFDDDAECLFRIMPAEDFIARLSSNRWQMNSLKRWRLKPRNGEMKMHRAILPHCEGAEWLDLDENYFFTYWSQGEPSGKNWRVFGDKNSILLRTTVGKIRLFLGSFYSLIHPMTPLSELLTCSDVLGVEKVTYIDKHYLKRWKKNQIRESEVLERLPMPIMDILSISSKFSYQKEYRGYLFLDDESPLVEYEKVSCKVKRRNRTVMCPYILIPFRDISSVIDSLEIKTEIDEEGERIRKELINLGVPDNIIISSSQA